MASFNNSSVFRNVFFILFASGLFIQGSAAAPETCPSAGDILTSEADSDCLGPHDALKADFRQLLTFDFWTALCRKTKAIETCLAKFSSCDNYPDILGASVQQLLDTGSVAWIPSIQGVSHLIKETCDGEVPNDNIHFFYNNDAAKICVSHSLGHEVEACVQVWAHEKHDVKGPWELVDSNRKESLFRFARSSFSCVLNVVLHQPNCSHSLYKAFMYAVSLSLPPPMRPSFRLEDMAQTLTEMDILSSTRESVGVYGDLHLLIHDAIKPITCSTTGSHVLLKNPLVVIKGVIIRGSTTGLRSLDIEFMLSGRRYGAYYTGVTGLPGHFHHQSIGTPILEHSDRQVDLTVIKENHQVRINSTSKAFVFTIERIGTDILFTLRLGKNVLSSSSGVLVTGCSYRDKHVIDITPVLAEASPECVNLCANLTTGEGIRLTDTCLYDCHTKGHTKDQLHVAKRFMADLEYAQELDGMMPLIDPLPTNPSKQESPNLCAATSASTTGLVLTILLCLLDKLEM